MTAALDATPLSVPTGGVRRYTAELSRALAAAFPDDEFRLLSDQPFTHPAPEAPNLKTGRRPNTALDRRWWLRGLNREMSRVAAEVFHGTDFAVPYLPLRPAVMTVHDLSPWMDRAWHAHAGRVRQRAPWLIRLGLASMIVTPSEAVRRQALERFRIAPDRVTAIPLAASRIFRPVPRRPGQTPFFLYAGTLEPRKNIGVLVEAWRQVRKTFPVDLVLAGRRRADFAELPPEPGLRLSGAVPDEELAELYSGAVAFLYPSLYEGFGLPVIEAMQCGTAVFTSRDAALGEAAGDAAVALDAGDPKAWSDAMTAALTNTEWIAALRIHSLLRARAFSWRRTAQLTREAYAEALRRFRRAT